MLGRLHFFYSKTTRENYLVGEGANIFGIDPLSQKMMEGGGTVVGKGRQTTIVR